MSKATHPSYLYIIKFKKLRYVVFGLYNNGNIRIEARGLKKAISPYRGEIILTPRELIALTRFLYGVENGFFITQ